VYAHVSLRLHGSYRILTLPLITIQGDRNNVDHVKIARDGIEPSYQYLLVELIFTLQLIYVRDLTCTSTYYYCTCTLYT
jgi:hypothetical protein